jgi:tetratricopeptide (TPR) repeat protein
MYRFDEGRRLPAAIVSAAVFAAPFLAAAQASTSEFSPARPTLGTTAAPVPQPTPEALGDSLMAHRRYQAAIEAYKQSSEMTADVWNKMGISYQMMFNLQDATRCYQESLKLEPKNVNVLNNLGTVYDSLKQYKMSVRMYHRAL